LVKEVVCSAVYFPFILHDIWSVLDPASQDYFRREREAQHGGTKLEDLQANREMCVALCAEMLRGDHFFLPGNIVTHDGCLSLT